MNKRAKFHVLICHACGRRYRAYALRRSRYCPQCRQRRRRERNRRRVDRHYAAIRSSRILAAKLGPSASELRIARALASRYPHSVFAHLWRNGDDEDFIPAPASRPTTVLPGTAAKISVMAARVLAGEECHHPHDARS